MNVFISYKLIRLHIFMHGKIFRYIRNMRTRRGLRAGCFVLCMNHPVCLLLIRICMVISCFVVCGFVALCVVAFITEIRMRWWVASILSLSTYIMLFCIYVCNCCYSICQFLNVGMKVGSVMLRVCARVHPFSFLFLSLWPFVITSRHSLHATRQFFFGENCLAKKFISTSFEW